MPTNSDSLTISSAPYYLIQFPPYREVGLKDTAVNSGSGVVHSQ